jgi:acetyltransferase-like isoleucine patch superfamily enzyme
MELYLKIRNALYTRIFRLYYQNKFKNFGNNSRIILPLNLNGIKNISIGENVFVAYKSWLASVPLTGESECELIIGDGSSIGNFNHIYATKSIVIGKNVLTADKVYISDNLHGYEDVSIPISHQQIKQIGTVIIGDGTWLGENVCIIGAKIGKNCVIGANSVVTKDVPDFCVVVGAPSYIIKKFCQNSNEWKKTDKAGNFLK